MKDIALRLTALAGMACIVWAVWQCDWRAGLIVFGVVLLVIAFGSR
jgi:hypothetical protein